MRRGAKRFVFRQYWWSGPLIGAAAVAGLWELTQDKGTLVLTSAAGVLSAAFFIQQQRLAETKLFRELVVDFNKRYNELNEPLQHVVQTGQMTEYERFKVLDYFNLCAEEYLFFDEGYIDHRVWQAWRNGMEIYFGSPPIAVLWAQESKSNSYYGFDPNLKR